MQCVCRFLSRMNFPQQFTTSRTCILRVRFPFQLIRVPDDELMDDVVMSTNIVQSVERHRDGGSHDPNYNTQLSQLIDQAKKSSMPSATIQNIIKCAPSSKDTWKPAVLEFRGPGGCIIIADILTDNFPKTRQTISTILRKNSAVYSEGGSRNLFDLKGVVEAVPDKKHSITSNQAIEDAIEAGAEEVIELQSDEGKTHFRFLCSTELVYQVKSKLQELNYTIEVVDQEFIPHTLVKLNDSELEAVTKLCDKLHENPDVVRLYDNIE